MTVTYEFTCSATAALDLARWALGRTKIARHNEFGLVGVSVYPFGGPVL